MTVLIIGVCNMTVLIIGVYNMTVLLIGVCNITYLSIECVWLAICHFLLMLVTLAYQLSMTNEVYK